MNPQHDEINLVRLVRRLEKSVANTDDWKPNATQREQEIWLKALKSLQYVKYARSLVKNIEADEYEPIPKRIQRLKDIQSKLDRIDTFLKDTQQTYTPQSHRPDPILPTLPVPVEPLTTIETSFPKTGIEQELSPSSSSPQPPQYKSIEKEPSPSVATQGLSIIPPDPGEISPTLISTALPSLLPSYPPETAATSSFARTFGPLPTNRHAGTIGGAHGSTALHEELSLQLEQMAQQLKRNALHFSSSLEKDKAVVEDAKMKLEGNYDVMQKERLRLRDHRGKSSSTTWMVVGIVVLVLVLFVLMVGIIRFL